MKKERTNKLIVILMWALLLLIISPLSGYAQVPQTVNYQGYLTDSSGNPIDGTRQMTFSIYNVAAGGTALWTETQGSVAVNSGVYSVALGSITPITLSFNTQYYLGVEVQTDGEMTPRQTLTSAPSALNADEADYALNADKVDGQHASAFASSGHTHDTDYVNAAGDTMSGSLNVLGNVGIGTTTPGANMEVRGTTSGVVAKFSGGNVNGVELDLKADTSGGNEFKIGVSDESHPWGEGFYLYDVGASAFRFFINGDGNVGIGTTNPAAGLSLNGSGYLINGSLGFNRNPNDGSVPPGGNPAGGRYQITPNPDRLQIESYNSGGTGTGIIILNANDGNVGIGIDPTPASKLAVGGTIESTSGGIKFPDGTVQAKAGTDCLGRYEDNGDGTVTDCRTGLIWLKDANCFGLLNWYDAMSAAATLANGACGLTDGSGGGDWRLPTKTEWMAMVASAKKQGFNTPALTNTAGTGKWNEGDLFNYVQSGSYWSSTTYAFHTDYAWIVYMWNGSVNISYKNYGHYVWPVRSGQ